MQNYCRRIYQRRKDDLFNEQQIADYVAGKTVVLANAKDDQGQPCTKYLKFSHEKGRRPSPRRTRAGRSLP